MLGVFLVISTSFDLVKRGEVVQRSVVMMILLPSTNSLTVIFL